MLENFIPRIGNSVLDERSQKEWMNEWYLLGRRKYPIKWI